jgi:hypothetical protein
MDRNGDAAMVTGVGRAVGFAQEFETVHGILGMARAVSERPAALIAHGVDDRHADRFLEAFELAQNDRAMRPGTGKRDVKVIAVARGLVRRGAVAFHPIAESIFLALEFAGLGLFFGKLGHRLDLCLG